MSVEGRPSFVDSWGSACVRTVSALPQSGDPGLRRMRVLDGHTCEPGSGLFQIGTLTTVVASHLTPRLLRVPWGDRLRLMPPPEQPVTIDDACQALWSQARATSDPSPAIRLTDKLTLDTEQATLVSGSARTVLSTGESRLLLYLLESPAQWRSIGDICARVFARTDSAARTLVWKYASVLRTKLGADSEILQNSRLLGYRVVTGTGAD